MMLMLRNSSERMEKENVGMSIIGMFHMNRMVKDFKVKCKIYSIKGISASVLLLLPLQPDSIVHTLFKYVKWWRKSFWNSQGWYFGERKDIFYYFTEFQFNLTQDMYPIIHHDIYSPAISWNWITILHLTKDKILNKKQKRNNKNQMLNFIHFLWWKGEFEESEKSIWFLFWSQELLLNLNFNRKISFNWYWLHDLYQYQYAFRRVTGRQTEKGLGDVFKMSIQTKPVQLAKIEVSNLSLKLFHILEYPCQGLPSSPMDSI